MKGHSFTRIPIHKIGEEIACNSVVVWCKYGKADSIQRGKSLF